MAKAIKLDIDTVEAECQIKELATQAKLLIKVLNELSSSSRKAVEAMTKLKSTFKNYDNQIKETKL